MRFVFILFLVAATMGCSPSKEWEYLPESKDDEHMIYLVNHGWHTGLIIPGMPLENKLGFLKRDFSQPGYYEVGWGDKGFYQADKITVTVALKAVLWPTDSVMHIVAVPLAPRQYFLNSEIVEIPVSSKGLAYLIHFVSESFNKDKGGKAIKSGKGLYGQSLFYEGKGKYYLPHTCNSWVGRALEMAGMPVNGTFALTAGSVVRQSRTALGTYACCRGE